MNLPRFQGAWVRVESSCCFSREFVCPRDRSFDWQQVICFHPIIKCIRVRRYNNSACSSIKHVAYGPHATVLSLSLYTKLFSLVTWCLAINLASSASYTGWLGLLVRDHNISWCHLNMEKRFLVLPWFRYIWSHKA